MNRPDSDADFEVYRLIEANRDPFTEELLKIESTDDNIDFMIQEAINYIHNHDQRSDRQFNSRTEAL